MSDEYDYRVRSPGRVNLIGEHTDYTGGYVLPMATDLHTQLEATPDEDVTIHTTALEEQRTFSTTDREREDSWIDYVKGCYTVLEDAGYQPGGFRGELSGDLPIGSGLSSSASLELAVLAFLNDAYELGLSRERLAELGQRVENNFVGVSCGIMDQFAVALGEKKHALYLDTGTLEYEAVPFSDDVQVVVFHTGVERELVDSAYNQRRETVEAAMNALDVGSSVELEADDFDGLEPRQRQRLGYIARENDRVERAVHVLERGDVEAFGDLLVKAHYDIAENYEASCPELDYVVETAVKQGAYGARLTGAGWGGAAIALVDASAAESFTQSLREAYEQRYPEHDPATHLITPSGGVSVTDL
ncbi:galactokinase [Halorhabdus salina]|uniref:galactokinase n=1 Tax=Halorhabdus salina TaxID=2750670 RepID=UPI0015EEE8D9|nr:galactokinase [Halorhabdus salina]